MNKINSTEVKVWMLRKEITQVQIKRELEISQNLVWLTINGRERNRRVLHWLREHGCPEKLLPKEATQ